MITLYNEKDQKIKLISVYEVLEADMGESSISATVSFSEVQDFHPDWYVIYNGEKFRLGVRKPTGKKDTSSLSTIYTLVFKSEREDLKRYTFMDFVELGSGNPQPNSYNVPLYATLSQFVDRFNTNLNYYMQGWKMVLPDDYIEEGNAVSISFDNATLWDVLLQVYEAFGVRWTIDGKIIKVAFPTVELEYVFEYGKGNGLVSVERNNALERIITRLRGRGGEKNLPPDYFHTGDPDTNSFLQATYFKNLMPKSYRDYIRGYNAGSGTGSWAYNKGVQDKVNGIAITPVDYTISDKEDLWGISYGAIEPAEGIFPTLQGATRDGVRLDEVLYVEPVLSDGPRGPIASTPINIGSGGHEDSIGICGKTASNWYTKDCRDGISFTLSSDKFSINNPANKVQIRFNATPSITNKNGLSEPTVYGNDSTVHISAILELIDTTSEASGEVIRTYTVEDMDTFLWELEDVPVSNQYRFRVKVTWSADILKEDTDEQGKPILVSGSGVVVNISTYLTGAMIYEYERPDDKYEFKETFDIEIRDVWGISRNEGESDADYTYRVWEPRAVTEEMTVMFSDGMLAGEDYEFRIVGFSSDSDNLYQVITSAIKPTDAGGWRLTLQKSDAETEASGRYLPNTMQNAKAGDYFFFVNIAMPYDPYVYDAEERVLDYLDTQLALKDEEFPSFTITPSKIFCKDFAELSKLRVGSKVRVSNAALIGDTDISLHIQSITKRYTAESFNPEWNITISDQIVASGNPVSLLEGSVAVLNQKVYSNNKAVKEAIKSMSSTFLRRDGVAADSNSVTEFKKRIKLGREGISDAGFINGDINGKGFGVYTDDYGNRVVEADILVGRIGARFNEVEINQVTYSAGKQIFSSAGMVVNRVEDKDSAWRCYFDTENGAKRNYFAINDGAFSQRFTDAGIRQYWQRVVAMGANYIDITKGDIEPLVGDNIAQLGNSTDKSRQAALIIDETKDGGGLVTWYDDITDFTLSDKDSVNIGRIDGKTWLKVYGSAYIGDRNENQYIKYEDGILKVSGVLEVGSQISDALTVVEEGLVQTSRLMLGYMESDTVFRIMSGTNGIYDETKKGGGIAAWYGGPMADKEADNTLLDYAQSIIRFDGSGYFAGGNISWDKSGAGSMAGGNFSWDASGRIYLKSNIVIGDDEQETLGGILGTLSQILDWFELRTLASGEKVLYTKHNLASQQSISWRGASTSGGGTSEGGLIQRVYGYDNITDVFDDNAKNDTFNAYTIAKIAKRVSDIEENGISGDVDLTGYATEDWVLGKDYATNTTVATLQLAHDTLREEFDALNNVLNDDVSGKINTWNEVVDFLDEYSGSQDLATILAGINGDISTLQGKFTKDNIQTTLGIADWALAASKPSYNFSDILNKPTTLAGYGITDALSTSGGTINSNEATALALKAPASLGYTQLRIYSGDTSKGVLQYNTSYGFGIHSSGTLCGIYIADDSKPKFYNANNIAYEFLHEGNYTDYALSISGGTINGSYNPLILKSNDASLCQLTLYTNDKLRGIFQYNSNYGVGFNNSSVGGLYITNNSLPTYVDASDNVYTLLHANNYHNFALPIKGGNIQGDITFGVSYGVVKNIAFNGTTGWARKMVTLTVDDKQAAALGAYGDYTYGSEKNTAAMIYLGFGAYNETNLKIYPTYAAWGANPLLHSGNYTNYTYSQATINAKLAEYLPLTGGTISSGTDQVPLTVDSDGATTRIRFAQSGTTLGFFGFKGVNNPVFINSGGGERAILHADNYSNYALPLSGGILSGALIISSPSWGEQLIINRTTENTAPSIKFQNNGTTLGYLGMRTDEKLYYAPSTGGNGYDIIHSGNIGSQSVAYASNAGTVGGETQEWIRKNVIAFNTAPSFDANTELYSALVNYSNYNSWLNVPTDMRYGQVMNFNTKFNYLIGQLAWDINHNGEDTTRNLWWRAISETHKIENAKWHQIAFTDSNVASADYATSAGNADTLGGVSFQNILERNYSGTARCETIGWKRIAKMNSGNVILLLHRVWNNGEPEVYAFSISKSEGSNWCDISQISGNYNIRTITKIRVDRDGYIDFYYNYSSWNNVRWTLIGGGVAYTTAEDNPTEGTTIVEFETVRGAKSYKGYTGDLVGNAASATKLATARTIWGQSFDGSGDIDGTIVSTIALKCSNNNTDHVYFGAANKGLGTDYTGGLILSYGNTPLYFYTNYTERMRISGNGNVIIGGAPNNGAKLQVGGSGSITYLYFTESDGTLTSYVGRGGSNSDIYLYGATNLRFYAGKSQRMCITEGGNVLIGTTTDNENKLQVAGDVYARGSRSDVGGYAYYWGTDKQYYLGSNSSTDFYLWTTVNAFFRIGTNNAERLRITNNGNILIGTTTDNGNKLQVAGNISASGSISWGSASDRRLKNNINTIASDKAIDVIMALNPVTFQWNNLASEKDSTLKGIASGFIADEYISVIPNSSRAIWDEYKAIDYKQTIPFVVAVVQNHETRLQELEKENKELKQELNKLKGYGN